jgi:hypothetical protein
MATAMAMLLLLASSDIGSDSTETMAATATKAVTSVSGHRPPMKSQVKSILVVNLVLDRVGMLFIIIGLNICW